MNKRMPKAPPTFYNEGLLSLRGLTILAITALLLTGQVRAASAEAPSLTLQDAVRQALSANHELKAMQHSVSAAGEDVGVARSHLLPKLSVEERFMRTVNPTYAFMTKLNQERIGAADFNPSALNNPDPVNDFQTSLSVEQPLFAPKAYFGLGMAKQEFSARDEDMKRKKEEVAFSVVRTFLMVHTAREYVLAAEKAVEEAAEHVRIAEARLKAGLGLYSDTLRAATARTEAEQRLVSARKNLAVSQRALGLLLGRTEPVDVAAQAPDLRLNTPDYYTAASLSRRDVKALELRADNARKNIRMAEAGYLPVVGMGGSYQTNHHNKPLGSEGESWQFTAFLKWDLFDGAKREHESAKARYEAAQAEEYLNGLKKAVIYKVYEATAYVEEALKNAQLAAAGLKTAEEGRRLVKVRYENSLSPLVDLLNTQVSLDNARAGLTARENEYRLAIASLAFESGAILKDLGIE